VFDIVGGVQYQLDTRRCKRTQRTKSTARLEAETEIPKAQRYPSVIVLGGVTKKGARQGGGRGGGYGNRRRRDLKYPAVFSRECTNLRREGRRRGGEEKAVNWNPTTPPNPPKRGLRGGEAKKKYKDQER